MRERTQVILRWAARLGYGARGLVYLVFGAVALRAAWKLSRAGDVHEALQTIHAEPGGSIMLVVLSVGLCCYGLWRAIQSLLDVDGHGVRPAGLSIRIALLVSAVTHASLAWAGIRIALRWGDAQRAQPVKHAVAAILSWPWGREFVFVTGVVLVGAGIAHFYKAATAGFRKWFAASDAAMRWIDPVSRIGLCARGLLFAAVGGFVIYSAFTLHADDARGVQGVLVWVQQRGYGRVLLGAWAVGVMLFGIYSCIEAVVRRVGLSDSRSDKKAAVAE